MPLRINSHKRSYMKQKNKEITISLTEEEYKALRQVIYMAEAHIDEWKLDVMRERAKVKIVRGICKKFRVGRRDVYGL